MNSASPRLMARRTSPTVSVGRAQASITRTDVLHRFALPALSAKADAVPGRLNSVVITPTIPGQYLGQCRELCGANHRFMPTSLEVR